MNLLDVLLLSGDGEDEEGEDNGGGGGAGDALHGDRLGELKGALDRQLALNTGTTNRERGRQGGREGRSVTHF